MKKDVGTEKKKIMGELKDKMGRQVQERELKYGFCDEGYGNERQRVMVGFIWLEG